MTSYLRSKNNMTSGDRRRRQAKRLGKKRLCGICGKGLNPSEVTIDHIVPQSQGGCNEQWNLRAAHAECNRRRGASSEDSAEYRTAVYLHRLFGLTARLPA